MAFLVKSLPRRTSGPSNPGFAVVEELIQVSKAAATLPATGNQSIFTISGGRVLVKYLIGEVTTATDATVTNLKVTSVPTVGSAVDIASNLAIASFEKGAILVVEGDGTALIGAAAGSGAANAALGAGYFVLPVGTIRITTSATNAGRRSGTCSTSRLTRRRL